MRQRNIFCFVLIKKQLDGDQAEPIKRLVSVFTDGAWDMAFAEYKGFSRPKLVVAQRHKPQAVMISAKGRVGVLGSNFNGAEDSIPMGTSDAALFSSANAIATIDGYVYAAGGWRSVCRRTEPGKWENLADRQTLPMPIATKSGLNVDGFSVIDG